jgi:serine/threonine protein kinase
MYDISIYGLGKHLIHRDLRDLSNNLPTWKDLIPIMRPSSSIPEYQTLGRLIEDLSGNSWLPAFRWDSLLSQGTYGKVYKGNRIVYQKQDDTQQYKLFSPSERIVLKEISIPINIHRKDHEYEVKAIMYEATIHALVTQFFKHINWSFAVPNLYEIFSRGAQHLSSIHDVKEVVFCMEYIRGNTLHDFLKNQFTAGAGSEKKNDAIYLRILAEIALQLREIQVNLRMNHRDVKVNNILIRDRESSWLPVFQTFYPGLSDFDKFNFNVVLIDYGFACVACGEGHDEPEMSLLEAGSWFGPTDACFKSGRDLVQFIYCIECYFPCRRYFSDSLCTLIEKWMTVSYSEGTAHLWKGLLTNGKPNDVARIPIFDTGIYEFLRRAEVNPSHCAPQMILEDIQVYYENH